MKASEYMREKNLCRLARFARAQANRGWVNYGLARPAELAPYTWGATIDGIGVRIIFSRDAGMHTGGWLKNPDYDRCYHLSISYRSPDGSIFLPQDHRLSREICRHIFGEHTRWLWVESPKSDDGKQLDVWHYRLMCDEHWQPILPRKEVYSKDFTEAGWKSFSEIHGHKPLMAQEA